MLSERVLRLLTAYVDGEVNARQRKAVLRYLRASQETRALLKQLQDDAHKLRQLPAQKVGHDLSQNILERIGDLRPIRISVPQVPSPVPRGFGLATAAAVLLALGFGSFYYLKVVSEKDSHVAVLEAPSNQIANAIQADDQKVAAGPEAIPREATPRSQPAENKDFERLPLPSRFVEARPKQTDPDRGPPLPPSILASPSTPTPLDHFAPADVKVAMRVWPRELKDESGRQRLLERLQGDRAQHIDLYCKQTRAGLDRLERVFKAHGIGFVVAPDAMDPYLFAKKRTKTDYVLFTENVTPGEMTEILFQLAREDGKAEAARKGPGQFGLLLVNGVTKEDHDLLGKVLGVAPTQLHVARPKTPLHVDVRKPVQAGTADEVARSVQGKGRNPRPEPGKASTKSPERLVIVGTCNPVDPKPESAEINRFRESRKERKSGTIQMLLVLRQEK